MEDYKKKAEQNMIELQEKKEKVKKSFFKVSLSWLIIAILLVPAHLAINYYFPDNHGTGVGELIGLIGIVMFVVCFSKYYEVKLK